MRAFFLKYAQTHTLVHRPDTLYRCCKILQESKKNTRFKNRLSTLEKHEISSTYTHNIDLSFCLFIFFLFVLLLSFGRSVHEFRAFFNPNRKQVLHVIFDTWFCAAFLRQIFSIK